MSVDFEGNGLQDIAALVGALIALALALQAAVGPTVMFLTEAVKSAFNVTTGKGGLLAIGIGCLIAGALGLLTAVLTDAGGDELLGLILIGIFAGLFMGAGAIQTHKAAGSVNVEASADIAAGNAFREPTETNGTNLLPVIQPRPMSYGYLDSEDIEPTSFKPERFSGDYEDDPIDEIISDGPSDSDELCDCTPNLKESNKTFIPQRSHDNTIQAG